MSFYNKRDTAFSKTVFGILYISCTGFDANAEQNLKPMTITYFCYKHLKFTIH